MTDRVIPLGPDETVRWQGRPRRSVVYPTLVIGVGFALVAGLVAWRTGRPWLIAGLPVGLSLPAWRELRRRQTRYLITDAALYHKRGVVGHAVRQVYQETVQNTALTQDVTGSLFGYGTLTIEVAGGRDLTFDAIGDPDAVRGHLAMRGRTDGVTGDMGADVTLPGSLAQWQAVRSEVKQLAETIERRRT